MICYHIMTKSVNQYSSKINKSVSYLQHSTYKFIVTRTICIDSFNRCLIFIPEYLMVANFRFNWNCFSRIYGSARAEFPKRKIQRPSKRFNISLTYLVLWLIESQWNIKRSEKFIIGILLLWISVWSLTIQ